MRKCPRCQSSMLMDYDASINGRRRTWRCLGCGRETFADASAQAEEDQMFSRVRREVDRHRKR